MGPKVSRKLTEPKEDNQFNYINKRRHWKRVDKRLLEGKSIVFFRAVVRSPSTLYPYERRVCNFLNYIQMSCDDFVGLAKSDPSKAETILIHYIIKDKDRLYEKDPEKRLSPNTLINRIKPLKLLMDINDVNNINWKKIRRFLPSPKRFANDRVPTLDELRRIYDYCDMRGKAMLLLLLTSGMRMGALEGLCIKHMTPIVRDGKVIAAKIRIYADEPEEYTSFITHEAYDTVQNYLGVRQRAGEMLGPDSPLLRDKFDTETIRSRTVHVDINSPTRCTTEVVSHYFMRLLFKYGFRKEQRKRHEFSIHSFRKWFKTQTEQTMKPINVEILMGHSVGLSDSYYRPTETQLLEDYLKAAPTLSLSEATEMRHQMSEREKTLEEKIAQMESRITSLLPLALAGAQLVQRQTGLDLNHN